MKILSIDPGYGRVGIAILKTHQTRSETVEFSTCLETDKKSDLSDRIQHIGNYLDSVIKDHAPDIAAMESLFMTKNQKTVMGVAEARGAMKYIIGYHKLPLLEYTPLQIKIALTGYGRATKDQVLHMVASITGIDPLGRIDDELDAIAVGITCCSDRLARQKLSTE